MSLIESILADSGVAYRQTRWTRPPAHTYAVYMDDVDADGPDGYNRIFEHDITIELYEPLPDDASEAAIEKSISDAGFHWVKQDRYWIQEEQVYQTIYEFTFFEKG